MSSVKGGEGGPSNKRANPSGDHRRVEVRDIESKESSSSSSSKLSDPLHDIGRGLFLTVRRRSPSLLSHPPTLPHFCLHVHESVCVEATFPPVTEFPSPTHPLFMTVIDRDPLDRLSSSLSGFSE